MEAFRKLGLSETTIKAIEAKGYTQPTEIQQKAIPLLLEGKKDVVGQSQTGTGKTASFALPLIEKIKGGHGTKALILTPTRELAVQVTKDFESLKGKKDLKTLTVYGGASITDQIRKLGKGVDIVVGTPGRVMDLIKRRKLVITGIDYCVLDEADEMLNMGFVDDIELILKGTPKEKQMLLFSATMPPQIKKIAEKFMKDYITIKTETKDLVTDLVEQIYYDIHGGDRFEGIRRIIDITEDFHGIIFCKTKLDVDRLSAKLINANYSAGALHGDISQSAREKILAQFKKKNLIVLIATDVAARGIDVSDLTHVINYSLPQSPELYVHRIGRTGRAGKKGTAITFVMPSEKRKLKFVERAANCVLIRRELPKISDVIKVKQNHVEEKIEKIVSSKKSGKFDKFAENLLEKESALNIIGALLEYSFGKVKSGYSEISKVKEQTSSRERRKSDRTRRFGGRGESRGSSRGNRGGERSRNRRGDSRGSSRGTGRGDSRVGSRGDNKGNSREPSKGGFGHSRNSKRNSSDNYGGRSKRR